MRTKLVRRCVLGAAISAAMIVALGVAAARVAEAARRMTATECDTLPSTPIEPIASGPLDEGTVRALFAAGRAASLYDRLAPGFRESLDAELGEPDEALGRDACTILAEEARVAEALRRRSNRCFLRRTDFELPDANEGKVLAEPVPSGGVRYLLVRWSEWPLLRQLHEQRVALITQGRAIPGDWIIEQFERHGLALFHR